MESVSTSKILQEEELFASALGRAVCLRLHRQAWNKRDDAAQVERCAANFASEHLTLEK